MNSIWVIAHDSAAAADLVRGARGLVPFVGVVNVDGDAVPGADLTITVPLPTDGGLLESVAAPIADLLVTQGAHLVLFSGDTQSRLLAGTVAALLHTSVRNITSITSQGDATLVTRAVYGGLAVATEQLGDKPAVLIVGAGALPEFDGDLAAGEVRVLDAGPIAGGPRIVETRPKQVQAVNLAASKRVVGVGRGFAAEADLGMARDLAAKIDGEIACSRPIAEGVNWLPVERYLGVSGATIRPDLYIAVGISGQVQHMVGVNRAKTIVAINKDKAAPIFQHADYGIVGDLYDVLPALIAAL